MNSVRHYTVLITNLVLMLVYVLGGLVIIAPNGTPAIPQYFGNIALGAVLLMLGLFGSPYCIEGAIA